MSAGCTHDWWWAGDLYGDSIRAAEGMRSWWTCHHCDAVQFRPLLGEDYPPSDPFNQTPTKQS